MGFWKGLRIQQVFWINELGFLVGDINGPLTMGSIKSILYPARQMKQICPCAAITFVSGKKIS
ncbi:hypothetical protein NC651_021188 [Populus alba x Populus x berolinensis]|nr:hypothetical protein NC651_021188 [Populus alba x Populus x berolinensis]